VKTLNWAEMEYLTPGTISVPVRADLDLSLQSLLYRADGQTRRQIAKELAGLEAQLLEYRQEIAARST